MADTPLEVVLNVDSETAPYIETKPLHGSQQTEERYGDGSMRVKLSIIPNLEFNRLLLGFGRHIEVVSPQSIRDAIRQHITEANKIYYKE